MYKMHYRSNRKHSWYRETTSSLEDVTCLTCLKEAKKQLLVDIDILVDKVYGFNEATYDTNIERIPLTIMGVY